MYSVAVQRLNAILMHESFVVPDVVLDLQPFQHVCLASVFPLAFYTLGQIKIIIITAAAGTYLTFHQHLGIGLYLCDIM